MQVEPPAETPRAKQQHEIMPAPKMSNSRSPKRTQQLRAPRCRQAAPNNGPQVVAGQPPSATMTTAASSRREMPNVSGDAYGCGGHRGSGHPASIGSRHTKTRIQSCARSRPCFAADLAARRRAARVPCGSRGGREQRHEHAAASASQKKRRRIEPQVRWRSADHRQPVRPAGERTARRTAPSGSRRSRASPSRGSGRAGAARGADDERRSPVPSGAAKSPIHAGAPGFTASTPDT